MIIYKYFPAHDQEAFAILHEIQDFLKIDCQAVEIFHIYAFEDETQRGGEIIDALLTNAMARLSPPNCPTISSSSKIKMVNTTKSRTKACAILGLHARLPATCAISGGLSFSAG